MKRGLLPRATRWLSQRGLRGWLLPVREQSLEAFDNTYEWKCSAFQYIYDRSPAGGYQAYLWGVLEGASLARALGYPRISAIEFGVAGGRGLLALEEIAAQVEQLVGLQIDVYVFDTGTGLPAPIDYRDVPYMWNEGFFPMDKDKLLPQLKRAQLKLGLIEKTIPEFLADQFTPVAFISFDLDLYTGTRQALSLLETTPDRLLPRVSCYFDDIMGYGYNEFTGERLAISEFNATHALKKVTLHHGLKWFVPWRNRDDRWVEMMYLAHIFDHPHYGAPARSNILNILDISGTYRQT